MLLCQTMMRAAPIVVCAVATGPYVLLGDTITAPTAFPPRGGVREPAGTLAPMTRRLALPLI